MSEVGMAVQVAFLVASCNHATYYRALKLALGNAVSAPIFMYPVVKEMVCEEAEKK